MAYKNAFNCKKCPQSNGENGCPVWWEIIHTETATGNEKVVKACGLSQDMLPSMLVEVIKASNRPAAEIGAMRQNVVDKIHELAQSAMQLANNSTQQLSNDSE